MKIETVGDLRLYLDAHKVEDSVVLKVWTGCEWEQPLVANVGETFGRSKVVEILLFGKEKGV